MSARLLLLALDSADAELLERWMEEGALPVLAGLRREGLWCRLATTAEVMHVSAWPSLYTGTHPGRHGLYHAFQWRAGEQRVHRTDPRWRAVEPFWATLDRAGRRVIVMDAFMDAPVPGFRGLQIIDYGSWTWFWGPASRPEGLFGEIRRRFGRYPAPEHLDQVTIPDPRWFRDRLVRAARHKGEVVRWLLAEHPWEMAFVMFGETHGGGHYLWHAGDPDYPLRPKRRYGPGFHPLRDVYRAVDEAIGRLLEAAGEETDVLVVSGDGMGPNYSGSHLLPPLLEELGLLRTETGGEGGGSRNLASRLRALVPLSVRQSLSRCLPRAVRQKLAMTWLNLGIDWSHTRVFCIPNSNEGYFRLNLEGREPLGAVAEAEAAGLVEELARELRGLVNPDTGRRCAHGVHVVDQIFPGPQRPHLPDLVLAFDPAARTLDRIAGPRAGAIAGPKPFEVPAHYTGNHRPLAFLLARGPRVRGEAPVGAHILDLAPTVLALFGLAPDGLDGRPLPCFRYPG